MSNKVDVLTDVVQSLDQEEVKKALKEAKIDRTKEPCSERMYLGMPPSMKSAIIEKVMASRKPGKTTHGAISSFIREAIVLHLERK
jgi:hypothetical protein